MSQNKSETLKVLAEEIDSVIRTNRLWFDFHVFKFEHNKLIIAGSTDLTYYHEMEIIFENVQMFHGFFNEWHSEVENIVFEKLDDLNDFNGLYEIEQGNYVFRFTSDSHQHDIIIAARNVSYNTDTVLYYYREDLGEKTRLAYFVKPPEEASKD